MVQIGLRGNVGVEMKSYKEMSFFQSYEIAFPSPLP